MKASLFALAAAVSVASAQLTGIPQCAVPCLTSAIAGVGCQLPDVGCQCSSTDAIQASAAGCILGACTAAGELQSAISGGLGICSAYLATVSATQTAGTTTASGTASASATTTASATSTISTSTVTPVTTSIPSPTTTPAPVSNSTTSRGSTTSRAPASTSQVPVGAGAKVAGSIGGIVGLMVAFLAL